MVDPVTTGFLPTVERLINSYGVGTSLLCAICYFVYLTYSKMHSDHQCKELVDTLLKRVKDLENQVGDLTQKLEEENKEISDLRVRNRELEIRLSHMESSRGNIPKDCPAKGQSSTS